MPPSPRDLVNYIGELTTLELAALPVEQVRLGQWCWNKTNIRPEIYDGTHWIPFCASMIDGFERSDEYHHMHLLMENNMICNGFPSQRRIVTDSYGRKITLWADSTGVLYLTVEINPDNVTVKQRDVTIYKLAFVSYDTEPTPIAASTDACMTIQPDNTIHIFFTSLSGENPVDLYDAYFPTLLIPYEPDAPSTGQQTLTLPAEKVNQLSDVENPCSHPSAAASEKRVNGGYTVVVAYTQVDTTSRIMVQDYDPAAVPGSRYTTVPAVLLSDSKVNADFATVECSYADVDATTWMNHVSYVMATLAGPWRLFYSREILAGWAGVLLPVDSGFYHINANDSNDDLSAPTMVINIDPTAGPVVSVVIQDMTNDSSLLFAFHFTPDIVSGVPVIFLDEALDVFDDTRPANGYVMVLGEDHVYIRAYQLGISNISDNEPIRYLYKYMGKSDRTGVTIIDFVLMYRQGYVQNLSAYFEPWVNVPLRNNVGETQFVPKVHFAFFAYNREWRSAMEEPYYPYNVAALANLAILPAGIDPPVPPTPVFTYSMIAKSIPAYPLEPTP